MRPSSSVEDVAAMAVAAALLSSPRKRARTTAFDAADEEVDTMSRQLSRQKSLPASGVVDSVEGSADRLDTANGVDFTTGTFTTDTAGLTPEPRNVSLSVQSLLGIHSSLEPGQSHEDDTAEVVLVCEPDLHNNLMGALHPNGALYEKPVNINVARCAGSVDGIA